MMGGGLVELDFVDTACWHVTGWQVGEDKSIPGHVQLSCEVKIDNLPPMWLHSPEFIILLLTDLGVLNSTARSDELIQNYVVYCIS
jgi:hypothetical protein